MKKIYTTVFVFIVLVLGTQAQEWIVYDADVLPDVAVPAFEESNVAGDPATNILLNDPDVISNSLLELICSGESSRFMWKHELPNAVGDSLTLVMRFKGTSDTLDRVMEIDVQQDGFRERLYIYTNNTFKLQEAGFTGDLTGNVMDWHIYRITKIGDSVSFYFDENEIPLGTVTTPTSSIENYFRFGDGNGSSSLGGVIDWVIWDTTGAYAPSAGTVLPDTLAKSTPGWKVYAANEDPLSATPVFVASNTGGSADTNTFNTIIEDPDLAGNNLLEEITNVKDARYMFRQNLTENPTKALTIVGRIKGISTEYDRVMEIDLDYGGFRERLYINSDSTFEVKESGFTGKFDASVLGWHIYRITKVDDTVNVYLDENPVPVASVVTGTVATNNYFRFGDGNSSVTLGGYVDWMIWDESGAYAPGNGNFIPDSLSIVIASSVADLSELTVNPGTLDPAFHADSTEYNVVLPEGTNSVSVSATALEAGASVAGTGDIDVTSGSGTATIVVTATDQVTTKTYTVLFTVEEPLSDDATLASLTPGAGDLVPVFNPATTAYTLTVPSGTNSVTLTGVKAHEGATVTGDGEISILPGVASIIVTAEDGETQITYTVTINIQTSNRQLTDDKTQVYPIPFTNKLTITSKNLINGISIHDVSGKMLISKSVNAYSDVIEVSHLKAGVYFIKIFLNEGVIVRKAIRD